LHEKEIYLVGIRFRGYNRKYRLGGEQMEDGMNGNGN
jgi:hypothetical protein